MPDGTGAPFGGPPGRSVEMPKTKSGCAVLAFGFALVLTAPVWGGIAYGIGRLFNA